MSRNVLAACSALLIGLASPALAAPQAPDAARVAAAGRLLDTIHYDSLIDRTIEAYVADAQKTFPQRLEAQLKTELPQDLKDKLFAVIAASIRRAMSQNRGDLRRGTALIYATRFTTPEIEHLIQLQSDPVMVKMLAEMPQIATEGAALGQAAVQRELPSLTKEIEQVVKAYYGAADQKPAA